MRHILPLAAVTTIATCFWLIRPAVAQQPQSADQAFLRTANEINQAEMKLGKLAHQFGASNAVKAFSERMVLDHTRMNKELREIANRQRIALPEQLDRDHQMLMAQLSRLNGEAFDRAYAREMVSGHERAIEQFEAESWNGRDAAVRAWAAKWLPILKEHLSLAQEVAKEVR